MPDDRRTAANRLDACDANGYGRPDAERPTNRKRNRNGTSGMTSFKTEKIRGKSGRELLKKNIRVHNELCRGRILLHTVFPHEGLEIRALHVDIAGRARNVPVVSDKRFFNEGLFDLLN